MANRARRPLNRRRVLRAALRLVDREGLEALSMRRLGRALGVEAMSLYRHVPNKEAILDGIAELLTEEIEIPPRGTESWQESMRRITRSYRQRAHAHPNAFPLLALRPLRTPRAIARAQAVLEILEDAGFDERSAILAFRTLASYGGGFALEEAAGAPPHVTAGDRDEEFEFGLDAILIGLAVKLAPTPRGTVDGG